MPRLTPTTSPTYDSRHAARGCEGYPAPNGVNVAGEVPVGNCGVAMGVKGGNIPASGIESEHAMPQCSNRATPGTMPGIVVNAPGDDDELSDSPTYLEPLPLCSEDTSFAAFLVEVAEAGE